MDQRNKYTSKAIVCGWVSLCWVFYCKLDPGLSWLSLGLLNQSIEQLATWRSMMAVTLTTVFNSPRRILSVLLLYHESGHLQSTSRSIWFIIYRHCTVHQRIHLRILVLLSISTLFLVVSIGSTLLLASLSHESSIESVKHKLALQLKQPDIERREDELEEDPIWRKLLLPFILINGTSSHWSQKKNLTRHHEESRAIVNWTQLFLPLYLYQVTLSL